MSTQSKQTNKEYEWSHPFAWLCDWLNKQDDLSTLRATARAMGTKLDGDQIVALFEEEMDDDGYFDPILPSPDYYVLFIEDCVTPQAFGPYGSEDERDDAAQDMRSLRGPEHGIYRLNISQDSPELATYSAKFMDAADELKDFEMEADALAAMGLDPRVVDDDADGIIYGGSPDGFLD